MPMGIYKRKSLLERFYLKVNKTANCWYWVGAKYSNGYPCFNLNGTLTGAHRVSWLLHKGEIQFNKKILHKCDVPICINPNHLFIGTQSDNMRDKLLKGRHIGHRNGSLTINKINEIRKLLKSGLTQQKIADRYGVLQATISKIYRGITWGWIEA